MVEAGVNLNGWIRFLKCKNRYYVNLILSIRESYWNAIGSSYIMCVSVNYTNPTSAR